MDGNLGQIILLVVGLFIELAVPLFLSIDKQKLVVRLLGALIILFAIGWLGYSLGQTKAETMPPPLLKNVSDRLDFETGVNTSISLDVCDAIPPTWYENCLRASSRIYLSSNSFTGNHSLGYQADLLPNIEQVYSINIPVNPPAIVDAVSANIYLPESTKPIQVSLLVKINAEDDWKFSEILTSGGGWIFIYLDLQKTYDATGLAVSKKGIDEIDIDVFLPKAPQEFQSIVVEIDDIELYFPASRIFDSP